VEATATFIENLFPNCPEEKLKKKIDIPEPIHPSQEEVTGNNDEHNHQPPPDDLEFPPIDPPQPGDGHTSDDDSKRDTTKPQSPIQCPPKHTVEDVIDNDMQDPQGGRIDPDYQHLEEEDLGYVFNKQTQSWEPPQEETQSRPSAPNRPKIQVPWFEERS